MMTRRYQGYPYINPPVVDAPTISADDAARWHRLPRRQGELNVEEPASPFQEQSSSLSEKMESNKQVVYIDIPESSGSIVADRNVERDFEMVESKSRSDKQDPDPHVVYIDFPEASGSEVARSRDQTPDEPEFVQETIFYDQFENRRIDREKEDSDEEDEPKTIRMPHRRPNTLNLDGAGPSAGSSSYHPSMSKETDIYQGLPSPMPSSSFPEPPPAYSEYDSSIVTPVTSPEPVVEQPRPASPPKTQVILPQDNSSPTPMGNPNSDRKYLDCHHCGMRVHTLVVRDTGLAAHATACGCLLICCIPIVVCVYCTDIFKVKYHYCPNCNNIIGYQQPFSGDKIVLK